MRVASLGHSPTQGTVIGKAPPGFVLRHRGQKKTGTMLVGVVPPFSMVGTNRVGQQANSRQLMYIHLWRLGLSRWVFNHSTSSLDGRVANLIDSGPLLVTGCRTSNTRGEKILVLVPRVESDLSICDPFDCGPGETRMVIDRNIQCDPCVVTLE
ncbi:hypothetical protein OUZ56_031265 [Daphnia magna]|uniref:Uncharacterized protein n=1 Tax=Daphnia magna TaxID=35525 RepID=A0ABQ9ZU93_9CRUS|nr:hypothetical protein OUZ56_031265 [Daphnia magna]